MSDRHLDIPTSPHLDAVLQKLHDKGHKALIVGGAVRDAMLGEKPKDVDVEVYGTNYDELADTLKPHGKVNLVGKAFGVVKFTDHDKNEYDFSLPRRDNKTGVGHKDFETEFDPDITPKEAASRRDFTFNALAYDKVEGKLHDYFGGEEDLKNKTIRHTSEAFAEDPLRVLRGMQFSARYGMDIHPDTAKLAQSIKHEYPTIPKERVGEEFMKLATKGKEPGRAVDYLQKTGWHENFPALHALHGLAQDPEWHPEGDVATHTAHAMNASAKIADREGLTGDDRATVVFGAMCHDVGKATHTQTDGPRITSHGHDQAGGPITRQFLDQIGIKSDITNRVVPLVENHMQHLNYEDGISPRTVRRLAERLHPAKIKELGHVMEADHSGRPPLPGGMPEGAQKMLAKASESHVVEKKIEPLIKGRDILPYFDGKPGPHIGEHVKAAYQAQLDGEINTPDEAKAWLSDRMSKTSAFPANPPPEHVPDEAIEMVDPNKLIPFAQDTVDWDDVRKITGPIREPIILTKGKGLRIEDGHHRMYSAAYRCIQVPAAVWNMNERRWDKPSQHIDLNPEPPPKTSGKVFHVAPAEARESIEQHGLDTGRLRDALPDYEPSVPGRIHVFKDEDEANWYRGYMERQEPVSKMDIWQVDADDSELEPDRGLSSGDEETTAHSMPDAVHPSRIKRIAMPRDEDWLKTLEFEHTQNADAHTISAWHPGGDTSVGSVRWSTDSPPTVTSIDVEPGYQRHGLGTELLHRAKQMEPNLHHDSTLMPDGRRLVDSIGDQASGLVTAATHRTISSDPYRAYRAALREADEAGPEGHLATIGRPGQHPADPNTRAVARDYMASQKMPYDDSGEDEFVPVEESRGKRIAEAFEDAPHTPQHPTVVAAYQAFKDETRKQYDHLKSHGYEMTPWAGEGQPYKNSAQFTADVRNNRSIKYFKTVNPDEMSFGTESGGNPKDNPLLEDASRPATDTHGNTYHQTYNDLFRAVHDIYGHAKEGNQTGPRGEENAWRQHARMYSPLARRAMTTETRGQNSFVNFGRHLRRPDGSLPAKGEPDYVDLPDRPYADQKVTLLPPEFSELHHTQDSQRVAAKMYHAAPSEHRESIEQKGLQPHRRPLEYGPGVTGIFLYPHLDQAQRWAEQKGGRDVYEVDADGLKLDADMELYDSGAMISKDAIPPHRIKRIGVKEGHRFHFHVSDADNEDSIKEHGLDFRKGLPVWPRDANSKPGNYLYQSEEEAQNYIESDLDDPDEERFPLDQDWHIWKVDTKHYKVHPDPEEAGWEKNPDDPHDPPGWRHVIYEPIKPEHVQRVGSKTSTKGAKESWEGFPFDERKQEKPKDIDQPPVRTDEGHFVLYHGTSPEGARSIMNSKFFTPDDFGMVGFGTTPQAARIYGIMKSGPNARVLRVEVDKDWLAGQRATREIGGSGHNQFLIGGSGRRSQWEGVPPEAIRSIGIHRLANQGTLTEARTGARKSGYMVCGEPDEWVHPFKPKGKERDFPEHAFQPAVTTERIGHKDAYVGETYDHNDEFHKDDHRHVDLPVEEIVNNLAYPMHTRHECDRQKTMYPDDPEHYTQDDWDYWSSTASSGIDTPIEVGRQSDGYWVRNGHHRLAWAHEQGLKTIPGILYDSPYDDDHPTKTSWRAVAHLTLTHSLDSPVFEDAHPTLYHVAPARLREDIRKGGLRSHHPTQTWGFDNLDHAHGWRNMVGKDEPHDIWEIDATVPGHDPDVPGSVGQMPDWEWAGENPHSHVIVGTGPEHLSLIHPAESPRQPGKTHLDGKDIDVDADGFATLEDGNVGAYEVHQTKLASWRDVRDKAVRLRNANLVDIIRLDPDVIAARVQGDHHMYDVVLYRQYPDSWSITMWECSCKWGDWAFKRQITYVGRFCSHALATLYAAHGKEYKKTGGVLKVANVDRDAWLHKGKPFSFGVVSLLDGQIEDTYPYKNAEDMDFHHSYFVSPEHLGPIADREKDVFWMDEGEPKTMKGLPPGIGKSIREQVMPTPKQAAKLGMAFKPNREYYKADWSELPDKLYHVAPASADASIMEHGLNPSGRTHNLALSEHDQAEGGHWQDDYYHGKGSDQFHYRPEGVYTFASPEIAAGAAGYYAERRHEKQHIYEINVDSLRAHQKESEHKTDVIRDPEMFQSQWEDPVERDEIEHDNVEDFWHGQRNAENYGERGGEVDARQYVFEKVHPKHIKLVKPYTLKDHEDWDDDDYNDYADDLPDDDDDEDYRHSSKMGALGRGTLVFFGTSQPIKVDVEVARDAQSIQQGLMNRTFLGPRSGMAFVYPYPPSYSGFWMKNTLIPLSVAFWDREGRIIEIKDMQPCASGDRCPTYECSKPYWGAVEVNLGFFRQWGIGPGTRIELHL